MKVGEIIRLTEQDGWRLITTRGSSGNSNIRRNRAVLPLRENRRMILRLELKTASWSRQA